MKVVFCCSMMYYIIVFWWLPLFDDYGLRLLLKQLVTMEVIQWTSLWNTYKDEFENETNMLGGSLGAKAAEDLRQRIIEHVSLARHGFIFTLFRSWTSCIHFTHLISFRIFSSSLSITQGLHWRDWQSYCVWVSRFVDDTMFFLLSISTFLCG